MSDQTNISLAEEQAFQLTQAAIQLDNARTEKAGNSSFLTAALNANLEVWIALRTIVTSEGCAITDQAKQNLVRLAQFVADRTLAGTDTVSDETIDTLINVNLQISEGLLEGAKK
ncbi:conserved hypothetical protein [Candidatus Terasakiella magnetica]|nr:conserved hypothetical protein [Candidatus Terasakiella magnetica]